MSKVNTLLNINYYKRIIYCCFRTCKRKWKYNFINNGGGGAHWSLRRHFSPWIIKCNTTLPEYIEKYRTDPTKIMHSICYEIIFYFLGGVGTDLHKISQWYSSIWLFTTDMLDYVSLFIIHFLSSIILYLLLFRLSFI